MTFPKMAKTDIPAFTKALGILRDADKRVIMAIRPRIEFEHWMAALLTHAVLCMCGDAKSKTEADRLRKICKASIDHQFRLMIDHWDQVYSKKK